MKESDKRFLQIYWKNSLFVGLFITGIVTMLLFLAFQKGVFAAKSYIYFRTDNGRDIHVGQAVRLSGFKIGEVYEIGLEKTASVKVKLAIQNYYMKWITVNSKVHLVTKFVGEGFIEITPDSKAQIMPSEGVLRFKREKSITQMVEEVKNEIKPILFDLKQMAYFVNDPNGDIKMMIKNARILSEQMLVTDKTLNKLLLSADSNLSTTLSKIDPVLDTTTKTVNNLKKISEKVLETRERKDRMIKNIDRNLESRWKKIDPMLNVTTKTIANTNKVIQKINRDLPKILSSVNKTLENLQKLTNEFNKISPKLPGLVDTGEEVAESAKKIVKSLENTWPIKSGIKAPKEKTLEVDSYD